MDPHDQSNRWHIESEETLHENPYFRVQFQKVRVPSGEVFDYYVTDYDLAAAAVVVQRGDEFLLLKQDRFIIDQISWEIPAGGVEAEDPNPEVAAARELMEETGLKATNLEYLCTYYPTDGRSNKTFHAYHTVDPEVMTEDFDHDEVMEKRWFHRDEVIRMIDENEIVDGLTLTPLLMVLFREARN